MSMSMSMSMSMRGMMLNEIIMLLAVAVVQLRVHH